MFSVISHRGNANQKDGEKPQPPGWLQFIKKKKKDSIGKGVEKCKPSHIADSDVKRHSSLGKELAAPQVIKPRLTIRASNYSPTYIVMEMQTYVNTKTLHECPQKQSS